MSYFALETQDLCKAHIVSSLEGAIFLDEGERSFFSSEGCFSEEDAWKLLGRTSGRDESTAYRLGRCRHRAVSGPQDSGGCPGASVTAPQQAEG